MFSFVKGMGVIGFDEGHCTLHRLVMFPGAYAWCRAIASVILDSSTSAGVVTMSKLLFFLYPGGVAPLSAVIIGFKKKSNFERSALN